MLVRVNRWIAWTFAFGMALALLAQSSQVPRDAAMSVLGEDLDEDVDADPENDREFDVDDELAPGRPAAMPRFDIRREDGSSRLDRVASLRSVDDGPPIEHRLSPHRPPAR